jgi:CHAD domain-containing protein/HD-GYP domain-containing protein (c-di-GMP phosphodiesterase class II)
MGGLDLSQSDASKMGGLDMMEIEAKFTVPDSATFEQLRQLTELAGYGLGSEKVKHIYDRYLDSADWAFYRAGYACRLRRVTREGETPAQATLVATLKGLGGAQAGSGVHRRMEHEVRVEAKEPSDWPHSTARELALQLSAGQALHELFALRQTRYVRLVERDGPEGAIEVAELSLDAVTFSPDTAKARQYYELEVELTAQGREQDLSALYEALQADWPLAPESRAKFERGLAVAEATPPLRQQGAKGIHLTADEQEALQAWEEAGPLVEQRRACIILRKAQGKSTSAIAAEVGLSARQVRRWAAAFREQRMGIFSQAAPESVERSGMPVGEPPKSSAQGEAAESVTVKELCARHRFDVARAEHVQALALQLFDWTASVHGLSSRRRALLALAATLHDIGRAVSQPRSHRVGRDLILAQPLVGLDHTEQDMLASMVAFQRKKVRRRREKAFARLPAVAQRETLILAALLRIAVALDISRTQGSRIRRYTGEGTELQDKSFIFVVEGKTAETEAAAARRRVDLWQRLFDVDIDFMTEEQLTQVSMLIKAGTELPALPELASPGLLPDDPMSEAGRKIIWFHFLRMLRHEPGTRLGQDIEELHDMRVATRRMRAAIRVFGDFFEPQALAPFKKGLRRIARTLGPVRDLDVFEEKAGHYLKSLPEEARDSLDPLLDAWHAEREATREKMSAFLDSNRYKKLKRELADLAQTEGAGARVMPQDHPVPYLVRHVAPRLIYERYEQVRAYETVLDEAQITTLHALRIDCKYLRYTLEFLREVLGPEVEDVIKEIKAMQDHLGDLNDAQVAIEMLNDFLGEWDKAQVFLPLNARRSAEGIVNYMAARHAEKHRLLTTFPEAWAQLNRQEVRHWMALAIAAL